MKKIIALILAFAMLFSLAAILSSCNTNTDKDDDESEQTTDVEETTQEDAANEALLQVMPDGKDFEKIDISSYTLPATVTEAYKEASGGYVFTLTTTGFNPEFVIMCGVNADGTVSGAVCLASNERLGKEKNYGDNFNGKNSEEVSLVDTISGATKTTRAYKNAVADALNAAIILDGGSVDLRTEEEILNDNTEGTPWLEYFPLPDGTYGVKMGSTQYLETIEIPSKHNNKAVTKILDNGFNGATNLKSITIPDGVTSIEYNAFYNCSRLTSITIPNSVTSIGVAAFWGCSRLTSITIPNGVTSIGENAFRNCSSLTSITIPDGVTSIGSEAFYRCRGLTSITIPDGVTSIGNKAFMGCSSLTSITIPEGVTSIGDWAFYDCSSLTSITIPDSITSIGEHAFEYCSSLTSITIPDSVTSIGDYAFYNCWGLTSITIPDGVTSIGDYAFNGCSSLTSITFNGTKAQWYNIDKAYDWNNNTGAYTIYCTDGEITK